MSYTDKSSIIEAKDLNDLQDEIMRLDVAKINKTGGGDFSGKVSMSATGRGYYLVDKNEIEYPGLYDNGSNLWIGSPSSNTGEASHVGATYIAAGYDSSAKAGHKSFYVSVPNDTNTGGTEYLAWHNGYINSDKLYPVGSCYTMSTNTNPNTIFPGTSWTLINKQFTPTVSNGGSDYFTINTTNTKSLTSCYISRSGNQIVLRIVVVNKVSWGSDDTITVGTVNMQALGINRSCTSSYNSNVYCDAANAIPVCYLHNGNNDTHTATLEIRDAVGNSPSTATGNTYYFNFIWTLYPSYMLDSACNQFIWKRTA